MNIVSTLDRLHAGLRRIAPRHEISLIAASTLARLERSGPQRLSDLHDPEGVSQPAMTQLITRLERDGLATRGSDPADGRAVRVAVTDAGRAAVARRRGAHAEGVARAFRQLSAEERAIILTAVPALDRLSELLRTPD
ncbi:MarR family transcriptional regulator [Actinoplanes philippinensis]|uniref:DNA-binding transcriptional regulator, MarR family n=1 Tax=Actinoplanes philippinensis TaxID=35752 RepID=A0A1I2JZ62_9ACTN|nr:MarR family transcriptional regulator [Actinoplanes philippinensis]SFF60212.1 DNA-binding transcriptional regulator, MarR family [Actinoplanes philippinensis]